MAPETDESIAAAEPALGSVPIFDAASAPIEIGPADEDLETIELDPSPTLPPVLPSAVHDAPDVLRDAAL